MLKNFLNRLSRYIWVIFLNGLLTLLPFTLTLMIITFFYQLINGWIAPVYAWEPAFLRAIPGSGLAIVLIGIFLVGFFIKIFFLEPLVHGIEKLFFKLPLMRPVYSGIKQLVHAFSAQDEMAFQKVVMVHFLHPAIYSIGFLTSELPSWVNPQTGQKLFNVFIPTTPNPTSGFLVQVPESDIVVVELSRQEAMSLIISGGIIKPSRADN